MLDAILSLGPNRLITIAVFLILAMAAIAVYFGWQARKLEREIALSEQDPDTLLSGAGNSDGQKRQASFMDAIVSQFNLRHHLGQNDAREWLASAGYRNAEAEIAFLFARAVCAVVFFFATLLYLSFVANYGYARVACFALALCAAFVGLWTPSLWLNAVSALRYASIARTWPNCLDYLLICVECGLTIDQGLREAANDAQSQSAALADELSLTSAELSYLPRRRMAYDHLATRVSLDPVRDFCFAMAQSERYGLPIGHTIRILAQKNRDARLREAEQKAAALSAKLTLPLMVFFFLPLLILTLAPLAMRLL